MQYTQEEIEAGKDKTWGRRIARTVGFLPTLGATVWGGRVARGAHLQSQAQLRTMTEAMGKDAVSEGASLEEKRAAFFTAVNPAVQTKNLLNTLKSGDAGDVVDLKNKAHYDKVYKILEWALKNDPDTFKKLRMLDLNDKKDKDGNTQKSITHKLYDQYKDKLPEDYIDRAGLKYKDEDVKFFGHGTDIDGNQIGAGLPKELEKTDDPWSIILRKTIAGMKGKDVDYISKPDLMAMFRSDEFQKFGNSQVIAKAAETFARETVEAMQSAVDKNIEADPNYYETYNKRIHNYLKSTPARTLGFDYDNTKTGKPGSQTTTEKIDLASELNKATEKQNALQKQLDAAEQENDLNRIDKLKQQIEDTEKQIGNLETQINQQQSDVAEAQRQAEKNEEERKKEEEKDLLKKALKNEFTKPLSRKEIKEMERRREKGQSPESTKPLSWSETRRKKNQ